METGTRYFQRFQPLFLTAYDGPNGFALRLNVSGRTGQFGVRALERFDGRRLPFGFCVRLVLDTVRDRLDRTCSLVVLNDRALSRGRGERLEGEASKR